MDAKKPTEMKPLDQSRYLQALGLFTMARAHAERAEQFRTELITFLGVDGCGYVEDAVWEDGAGLKQFDAALALEGFTIERDAPSR